MEDSYHSKLVSIIPIRNESKIIETLYKNLEDYIKKNPEYSFILALDNCTDNTIYILKKIAKNKNIIIFESDADPGYGNIVRFGFAKAHSLGFEWGLVIDSDLSSPLAEIPRVSQLISNTINPKVVVIKGNRFDSAKPDFVGVPIKRLILSKTANQFTRILGSNNSKDLTNGFRAVNLEWFMNQNFKESGFSSIMEEAYRAISSNNLILDFKTSLRYDIAIRVESSFTFRPKIILSYAKYAVKIWGISIKQKIKM
jgi:glycosyltransferase involved in cell wall biosynthesis